MIFKPDIFTATNDAKEMIYRANTGWKEEFSRYSRFYHIATECVKDYVPYLKSDYDTALSIAASADQAIALNGVGAKELYLFDINRTDYYFIDLKRTAFLTLKRKEFLEFLIRENDGINILDYNLYKKVRNNLNPATREFWDFIYKAFGYNNMLIADQLFRSPIKHARASRKINDYYSNNQRYYETQSKVKNSNWYFIESDFYSLKDNLPNDIDFGAVCLSNIYEYLNFGHDMNEENAKKYVDFIKEVLLPRLKNNGKILTAYLCRYDEQVDSEIKDKLASDPTGWVPSDTLITLDSLNLYYSGYTGQNVSYHYLLEELKRKLPSEFIHTDTSGYGMSNANNDLALVYTKK